MTKRPKEASKKAWVIAISIFFVLFILALYLLNIEAEKQKVRNEALIQQLNFACQSLGFEKTKIERSGMGIYLQQEICIKNNTLYKVLIECTEQKDTYVCEGWKIE